MIYGRRLWSLVRKVAEEQVAAPVAEQRQEQERLRICRPLNFTPQHLLHTPLRNILARVQVLALLQDRTVVDMRAAVAVEHSKVLVSKVGGMPAP